MTFRNNVSRCAAFLGLSILDLCLRLCSIGCGLPAGGSQTRIPLADWGPTWLLVTSDAGPIDLTLALDARTIRIGQLHHALIWIDTSDAGVMLEARLATGDGSARLRRFSDGRILRKLLTTAFALRRYLAGPLVITRRLRIDRDGEVKLDAGSVFPRHDAGHLAHVVDLAATTEAMLPSPSGDPQSPLISIIVPVYNAPVAFLDDLVTSFCLQAPGLGELVLSDDASTAEATRLWLDRHADTRAIVVVRNAVNRGIGATTNAGIERARGTWITFLDHDDALVPFALARIARELRDRANCQFLYTDEVITDVRLRPVAQFHKPAFDRVLLSGVNFVNHLSVYRRERLIDIGYVSTDHDGSQDYDLLLRYTAGLTDDQIVHLPYPAYLWRRSPTTFSARQMDRATTNARRALAVHFTTPAGSPPIDPAVNTDLHRVRLDRLRSDWPKVSVIIPSINAPALIGRLLDDLTERTDYPNLEIRVIDNGTTDPATLAVYERFKLDARVHIAIEPAPFNFSASVNKGMAAASGDILLLLNNDIEVLEPTWLREMVSIFDYGDVGIVGAKLLYPDRTLQHAGVIVGFGDLAGHWFIGSAETFPGPMGRLWVRQSMTAVTGACFAISRSCYQTVGSFDEANFAIAYNDIDYCLRARQAGYRIVWSPFAMLIHHESATRGSDETPANVERFRREQQSLKKRHATDRFIDPALNPWLSRSHAHPFLIGLPSLPPARPGFQATPSKTT